jgi:hypothetical protein
MTASIAFGHDHAPRQINDELSLESSRRSIPLDRTGFDQFGQLIFVQPGPVPAVKPFGEPAAFEIKDGRIDGDAEFIKDILVPVEKDPDEIAAVLSGVILKNRQKPQGKRTPGRVKKDKAAALGIDKIHEVMSIIDDPAHGHPGIKFSFPSGHYRPNPKMGSR